VNAQPIRLTAIVDASHRFGVTGIGIVLHATDRPGRAGPVIAQVSERRTEVLVGEMELFAVFRALELARDRGYRQVKVRSDANYMRRRLKRDHSDGCIPDPESLHGKTLALARTFDHVVFAYQPRRKNGAAHRLARLANEPAVQQGLRG
jgi:ribonuclease HI